MEPGSSKDVSSKRYALPKRDVVQALLKNLRQLNVHGGISEYLKEKSIDEASVEKLFRMCPEIGLKPANEAVTKLNHSATGNCRNKRRKPRKKSPVRVQYKCFSIQKWKPDHLQLGNEESIIPDQEEFQAAQQDFRQRFSIVILEALRVLGIDEPNPDQVYEIWEALDANALFWEEWAESH